MLIGANRRPAKQLAQRLGRVGAWRAPSRWAGARRSSGGHGRSLGRDEHGHQVVQLSLHESRLHLVRREAKGLEPGGLSDLVSALLRRDTALTMRRIKILALAVLAVPIAFISVLLIGETLSGGLGLSFGHVIQVVPLLLLAVLAWWRPLIAGGILVGAGALIAFVYPFIAKGLPVRTIAVVELILLLPVASGVLLMVAGRRPGPVRPGTTGGTTEGG